MSNYYSIKRMNSSNRLSSCCCGCSFSPPWKKQNEKKYILIDASIINRKLAMKNDAKERPEEELKESTTQVLKNICYLVQLRTEHNFFYEADNTNVDASTNLLWIPNEIERLQLVKQGNFGRLFIAKHSQGPTTLATLKVISKIFVESGHHQAKLWATVSGHPYISRYFGCCKDNSDNFSLYLVSEYTRGIPLQYFIKYNRVLSQKTASAIIAQMSSALLYMHGKGVYHRNITVFNVKINVLGITKIEEFGAAVGEKSSRSLQSLWQYCAPEMFEENRHINSAADWYPLGICLYEMLIGVTPMELYCKLKDIDFEGLDFQGQLVVALSMDLYFVNTLEQTAIDILIQFLQKKPNDRLGSKDDISQFKKQPFFDFINWNSLEAGKLVVPLEEDNYDIESLIDRYLNEEIKRFYL